MWFKYVYFIYILYFNIFYYCNNSINFKFQLKQLIKFSLRMEQFKKKIMFTTRNFHDDDK